MGRPEYCTDGKGSGFSSRFHGYRTEVLGRPEYCIDGKGSGYSSWFQGYRTEVWGVLKTVQMEMDLGSVAGSMVTGQRFAAS